MIKAFFISLFSFIIFDAIWLGLIIKETNMRLLSEIGRIENGKFQLLLTPAVLVYILMAAGLVYFVLPVIKPNFSKWKVFLTGALMGLVVYGVYDFTNLSVLKNYPVEFALYDILWGCFAFGVVTFITYYSAKKIR